MEGSFAEKAPVIFLGAQDHLLRLVGSVYADELHAALVVARDVLVGGEVMYQPADDVLRELVYVGVAAVDRIVAEHRYYLVVGLPVVQQPEAAYGMRAYDDVAVGHVLLGEHADVKRVAVSFHVIPGERPVGHVGHLRAAVGPRQEAVERRHYVGEFLRAVEGEIAGLLVDLVFHGVRGHYFYECGDLVRDIRPEADAVPGMGLMGYVLFHFLAFCIPICKDSDFADNIEHLKA